MKDETGLDRLKIIYGVSAILFLAVLAFSPLKDVFREWRHYQRGYNAYVAQQPVRIKAVPVKLQQIWVQDLNRVDRCTVCHLGVREKSLTDAPEPYRTHPRIYHDIEKFGCTQCHHGQGRSTEFKDAHRPTPFWDDPMLPKRFDEAGCGSCHREKELAAAPVLTEGRQLIEEYNCTGCHKLDGFRKSYTPPLTGVGAKVNESWLERWLTNPAGIRPETKMPNFRLAPKEIRTLADFLMSFNRPPGGARLDSLPPVYAAKSENDDFISQGKTLFREARCISCHLVEGKGGHLAPDLGKVASKVRPEWVFTFLGSPKTFMPGIGMPRYGFSAEERAKITAYIMSEFVDWDAPEDTTAARAPVPNFYEDGLRLFNYYNCKGCHELEEKKVTGNLGPELTAVGSKNTYELDFGDAKIPRTRYDFIYNKLENPRQFRPTLRMPQFRFTEEQLRAITTALLAQRVENLPASYLVPARPSPPFSPQGDVGEVFRTYSCLTCHTIHGDGGQIAPDLSRVGSQLQRDWVKKYFEVPFSRRPIQSERMPNLSIDSESVSTLLDYFYTVLLDDSLRIQGIPLGDAEAIEKGRTLYWDKYGCQSCHQIGSRGGYVGPPLDGASDRLQPGWIVRWLEDPQRYRPETLEPRSGMSVEEAKSVAAYLMTIPET
jgi:mono/diheme cytochrome c family protein